MAVNPEANSLTARYWLAAISLVTMLGTARAHSPDEEQNRSLVRQKVKLVEMLIDSTAARGAPGGGNPDAARLLEDGRQAIEAARKLLADGRTEEAASLLDNALKSVSSASRKLAAEGGGPPDSVQLKNFQELGEQVASYRASVADLGRDADFTVAAKALLGRIDSLAAEARQLAQAGRLGDANKKMAVAYRLAVGEITRLRAGQEVVMSLKFDTPADEFAYEQKRFNSNEIMIDMMIGEGRAEGEKRQAVDEFVGEGRKFKAQADLQAKAGQYREAVTSMEKASAQFNRAMQSMGVPVF